jgi:hypothetical protein
MSDYNTLNGILQENEFAQKLAVEEAASEHISRMSKEQQEETLLGMKVRLAQPTGQPPQQPAKLEFYQARELYDKQLERTQMIVQRMIPCGLTVLAGAPKRGKSWLALALGLSVASGAAFLGQPVAQGSVLYLDLESRQYRVKDRLSHLTVGPAPAGLYVAHQAEPLGAKFYQQMEGWLSMVKDARLIIIDTLGRVKPGGKRNENAYESDTRQYGELQQWAGKHKIAVIVVHHLRKTKDSDDWFDKINGSNGLVGAADAVLGLGGKRGEQVSKLMVSGRDIDGDYNMAIRFDGGRWVLESSDSESYEEEREYTEDPLVRGIYEFMFDRYEWQGTATQLLDDIVEFTQQPLDVGGSRGVGKRMQKFGKMLYDREGILFSYKHNGQRRLMFLRNTRNKNPQTTMEVEENG